MAPHTLRGWMHPTVNHTARFNQLRLDLQAMSGEEHIRHSAHAAGAHLVHQARRQLPEDLHEHVGTWDTSDNVRVGVHHQSEHHQRVKRLEWGDHEEAPQAPLRRSFRTHAGEATAAFYRHLGNVR